ncbi:hypothetical protein CAS74_000798 [Pichia kudriavzevii]|uniref:Large ribosomal subunit protein uL4m n=1 Tax=Pichia kudriavzevii TaxID=4909 RepID=A0A1Z8JUZ7_PICKU|nr:uncharacterized protein C5L36_0C07790 [Pichia kudriavzevii]AWU76865.1 hypothetical protein C5L36_0C07790 [Pichia kudriavzevii]OUT24410.1 hypothetical protein CAS74_000798 [Pichia kudriavzevii]
MFPKPLRSSISSTVSVLVRGLATSTEIFPNAIKPSGFSIATLRSFPSLEPHSIFPVHNVLVNQPLRRDILWLAAVMELDNKRVGASNPPGRSQHKFSRHKLFKQKGTGRARVGDANSPIRFRGAYALARHAPNDFSTDLPTKVYHYAYRVALSDAFRRGKLFIIGEDSQFRERLQQETGLAANEIKESDSFNLEIPTTDSLAMSRFVKEHHAEKHNLLFVANDYFKVSNLRESVLRYPSKKLTVLQKDEVQVRDILKAHKIFIEKEAFNYFAAKYTKFVNL